MKTLNYNGIKFQYDEVITEKLDDTFENVELKLKGKRVLIYTDMK